MESLLRAELGTDSARPLGAAAGGGCISAGQSYETGRGHVHFDRFVSSTPRSTTAPHCSSQQRTQLNNSGRDAVRASGGTLGLPALRPCKGEFRGSQSPDPHLGWVGSGSLL
ncbi:unnamed protein product [Lampetra planeri]